MGTFLTVRKHTGSSLEATGDKILSIAETSQMCSFPASAWSWRDGPGITIDPLGRVKPNTGVPKNWKAAHMVCQLLKY